MVSFFLRTLYEGSCCKDGQQLALTRKGCFAISLQVSLALFFCVLAIFMLGMQKNNDVRRLKQDDYLLVGLIVGTRVSLQLFSAELQPTPDDIATAKASFPEKKYDYEVSLHEHVRVSKTIGKYLEEIGVQNTQVKLGVLIVPGTVLNNQANISSKLDAFQMSSRWLVRGDVIAEKIKFPIRLMNDYTAAANSLSIGDPPHKKSIQIGEEKEHGNKMLLGLGGGFGMGQSYVTFNGQNRLGHSWGSEGGTRAFGPRNEDQEGLLRFIKERHNYAYSSTTAILGFIGIKDTYDFFADKYKDKVKAEIQKELDGKDIPTAARTIVEYASEGKGDDVCDMVLDFIFAVLGAYAGDAALNFIPRGGLYVAWLNTAEADHGMDRVLQAADQRRWDQFLAAFNDKGRSAVITKKIPINVFRQRPEGELEVDTIGALLWAVHLKNALDDPEKWKYISQFG